MIFIMIIIIGHMIIMISVCPTIIMTNNFLIKIIPDEGVEIKDAAEDAVVNNRISAVIMMNVLDYDH